MVFQKDTFEIFNLANSGEYLKEKPSNYVAGTVNRWRYDDIVDYDFFPSVNYPFIVFFKETGTPQEKWGDFGWWGKFAGLFDPSLHKMEGQPHFMPGLFNVPAFVEQMEKRDVKKRSYFLNKNK